MRPLLAIVVAAAVVTPALAQECFDYALPGTTPNLIWLPNSGPNGTAQVQDGLLFVQKLPDYSDPYETPAGAILALDPALGWWYDHYAGNHIGELFDEFLVVGDYVYAVDGNPDPDVVRTYGWLNNDRFGTVAAEIPLAAAAGALYAVMGTDVAVLDLAMPAAPTVAGTFLDGAGAHAAAVAGSMAVFLVQDGLRVVDASLPLAPQVIGSCPYANPPVAGLAPVLAGDLCLVGTPNGLDVYLLTDPGAPGHAGTAATAGAVEALAAAGDHAYVVARLAGAPTFAVVALASPGLPAVVGGFPLDSVYPYDLDIFGDSVVATARDGILQAPLQCGSVVPVLVSDVAATWRDGSCRVTWEQSDALAPVRLQAGCGDRTWTVAWRRSGRAFVADDASWVGDPGDEVVYALQAPAGAGWTTVAEVRTRIPEFTLAIAGPVPNPFNPATELSFTLDRAGAAELAVFDLAGRKVRTLQSGNLGAGPHTATWRGRDDAGRAVPAGAYFARLRADGRERSVKLMLLK